MDIIESLKWRYATKKFDTEKTLPQEKIDVLTEAFNLTATSYGLQPVKLVVLKNKTLQQKLVPHSWDQKQVADASHVLIICIEKEIDEDYITNYFEHVKAVRNTSDDILKSFREDLIYSFKEKPSEEITTWAAKQAYLALGNLLTVCAAEQIDACPMEGFVPEKYDELLSLKDLGLHSVLVLPVGYRAEDDFFSSLKKVRKSIDDIVINL